MYDEYDDIDELMGTAPDHDIEDLRKKAQTRTRTTDTEEVPEKSQSGERRKCNIPPDFDPTPAVHPLQSGYMRPPSSSQWCDHFVFPINMAKTFRLLTDDTARVAAMSLRERRQRFLASKCVSVSTGGKDQYYVKKKYSTRWTNMTLNGAKAQLKNDWLNCRGFGIGNETVDDFFRENRYPVLEGVIYVPNAREFLNYKGSDRLNTWWERQLPYREAATRSDHALLMMRIIFQNLLNINVQEWDEMLPLLEEGSESPARWFFHWTASVYQRPGLSLPTTLWVVGHGQGTGKGLFSEMMRVLVGRSNAHDANLKELKGDWNDFLGSASLIIGDEMTFDSRKDFYDMLKRYVSSSEIALRKRNIGQYMVPNVANWLFTTNNSRPVTIDENDRRNTFIGTTNDEDKARTLASKFYSLSPGDKARAYEGVAEFLGQIAVDDALIQTAIMTPAKEQLIGLSRPPFLDWLSSSAKASWSVGEYWVSDNIYAAFRDWARDNQIYEGETRRPHFNMQVNEADKRGFLKKARKRIDGVQTRGYELRRYPTYSYYDDAVDLGEQKRSRQEQLQELADGRKRGRRASR